MKRSSTSAPNYDGLFFSITHQRLFKLYLCSSISHIEGIAEKYFNLGTFLYFYRNES